MLDVSVHLLTSLAGRMQMLRVLANIDLPPPMCILFAEVPREVMHKSASLQANLRAGRQIDGSAVNGDGQSPPREAAANGQLGAPY